MQAVYFAAALLPVLGLLLGGLPHAAAVTAKHPTATTATILIPRSVRKMISFPKCTAK